MRTIKIKDQEYNVKYSIRALFIFESITKKPFQIKTLLDNYLFFYSIILASNKDKVLDWDDYLEALDEDPTIFTQISEIVDEENKKQKLFEDDSPKEEAKGEKKT